MKKDKKIITILSILIIITLLICYAVEINSYGLFNIIKYDSGTTFEAKLDNLGLVGVRLKYTNSENIYTEGNVKSNAKISVKLINLTDQKTEFVATSSASQIVGQKYWPIGFPPIPNSKGKKFKIDYELIDNKDKLEHVILSSDQPKVLTVYAFDKKICRTNKSQCLRFFIDKIQTPENLFEIAIVLIVVITAITIY